VLREYETVLDDVDDGGIHLGRIVCILVHLEVLLLHGYYCTVLVLGFLLLRACMGNEITAHHIIS